MSIILLIALPILSDIKYPEIRIIDSRAKMYTGTDTIYISPKDIIKYTGKICPGVSTGIRLSIVGLKNLYENSIPIRGEIRIAIPFQGELAHVIGYITGTRHGSTMIVDTNLVQDTLVSYVFGRKNGKSVKVTLNEANIHRKHEKFTLETFTQFLEEMLNGGRDDIFSIEELEYKFP